MDRRDEVLAAVIDAATAASSVKWDYHQGGDPFRGLVRLLSRMSRVLELLGYRDDVARVSRLSSQVGEMIGNGSYLDLDLIHELGMLDETGLLIAVADLLRGSTDWQRFVERVRDFSLVMVDQIEEAIEWAEKIEGKS